MICLSTALVFEKGTLKVLDQRKLPQQETWWTIHTPDEMVEAIQTLAVRGAPLIGVAAALSLAQWVQQYSVQAEALFAAAERLKTARPTAVNLQYAVNQVLIGWQENGSAGAIARAEALFQEDQQLCDAMAKAGQSLIVAGDNVMTYCNTGSLATVGIGTALGVIYQAHCREHKNLHVYACETRPLLQGARLTAWELEKYRIPYTLICDNMAATVLAQRKVTKIFVGADRIAKDGAVANKIGTYALAVLARYHRVPFYVVAPYTTLDVETPMGQDIVIEQRAMEEVRGVNGDFGTVQWSPSHSRVYNPAFDVTPRELITGYVFDRGVFMAEDFNSSDLFLKLPV